MTGRASSLQVRRLAIGGGQPGEGMRAVPEETAVAFVYDGGSEAVMMASPADLEDFAIGFSLNEGIITELAQIERMEQFDTDLGIEMRLWLSAGLSARLSARRRHRAGPTGCGLCGVESLEDALPKLAKIDSAVVVSAPEIIAAMSQMADLQSLNHQTRAVHAAGFYQPGHGVILVREDVGRHNALDKLAGAMARQGLTAKDGAILMTSRLSVELVQKAAAMGAGVLAAVSAPTAVALRTAEAAGMCLVGVVRSDGLEVFTGFDHITAGADTDAS